MQDVTVTIDVGKYVRIQQEAETARDGLAAARQSASSARSTLVGLQGDKERFRIQGHAAPPTLESEIVELTGHRTRADAHVARLVETAKSLGLLAANLKDFLDGQKIAVPAWTVPTQPRRLAGQEHPATIEAIEEVRKRIREGRAEHARLERTNLAQATAYGRIDRWLDGRRLDLPGDAFVRPGAPGRFDLLQRTVPNDVVTADANASIIEGLLANLVRPELQRVLRAAADEAAASRGGWGPSDDERQRRMTEIGDQVFQAELVEEALIEDLAARGLMLPRRADADPLAVLLNPAAAHGDAPIAAGPTPSKRGSSAAASPRRPVSRSAYLEAADARRQAVSTNVSRARV